MKFLKKTVLLQPKCCILAENNGIKSIDVCLYEPILDDIEFNPKRLNEPEFLPKTFHHNEEQENEMKEHFQQTEEISTAWQ